MGRRAIARWVVGSALLLACAGKSNDNSSACGGGGAEPPGGSSPGGGGGRPAADAGAGTGGGGQDRAGAGGDGSTGVERIGCAQELASGKSHSCIRYDDGTVACFGTNAKSQLGNERAGASAEPLEVAPLLSATRIAAGGDHTCALTAGGVLCWGDNQGAALGAPVAVSHSARPLLVGGTETLSPTTTQLLLGERHGCLLDELVHARCWGTDRDGTVLQAATQLLFVGRSPGQVLQLGANKTRLIDQGRLFDVSWAAFDEQSALRRVSDSPQAIIANAIGSRHDCLLKRSGIVFCRGQGYPYFYAIVADFGRDVLDVEAGDEFTCALTSEGRVLCRGRNEYGQLGNGSTETPTRTEAMPVLGIDGAVELTAGSRHACARLADGSVWCWGSLPGAPLRSVPQRISAADAFKRCSSTFLSRWPWGDRPPERAIDELADAALGWGQNQCRCAFGEYSSTSPSSLDACIKAETVVLNGCLETLAVREEAAARCTATELWNHVSCSLTCLDTGQFPASCNEPGGSPQCDLPGVLKFCLSRNLSCSGPVTTSTSRTCDGALDCENGFDEANCDPNVGRFTCADGSRIDFQFVRDGMEQCPDGSDEWGSF